MFIRNFAAAAMLVLAAFMAPDAFAQGASNAPKLGFIDSQKILAGAPDRQAILAQFQKETAHIEARLKQINDSNVKLIQDYQKDHPTLTPEQRSKREADILKIQQRWSPEADSLRQFASKRGEELERPLMEKLKKILDDVRQDGGYWMIVDIGGEGGMGIVAYDKNLDITDRVLAAYRAAPAVVPAKADAAKPGAAGPVNSTTGVSRTIPPAK